ncbi:MAG: HAD family hydrolase [Aphanocapsa lilacina HA4352-LM1]|jgi:phosphoglycolate phosphatase|nr:HAD family hydrolase [Aphanocapsa lilacina HA4352-LM1]
MFGRLVVFDLDGTLIDSEGGIVLAMERTALALALPVGTVERWRKLIGMPLREQMPAILPAERLAEAPRVVECYREVYREIMLPMSRPFAGTDALVRDLHRRGVRLAICSGKRGRSIREVLGQAGWSDLFEAIVSPDEVSRGKPDPESLKLALALTGFGVGEALMVGDTTLDIEMARAAGVACCAVTWGTHGREELASARPDHWVETVEELAGHLDRWLS